MPTRYLKQGICDSESIDRLSPLAENLYYRLLVNVDDFGRIDSRLPVIRARCFPLKDFSTKKIKELLRELADSTLVILYRSGDCDYIQFNKWCNKPRAVNSLFPECDADAIQLYADVNGTPTNLPVTVTGTGTVTVTETVTKPSSSYDDSFLLFWNSYPNKTGKGAAWKTWKKLKVSDSLLTSIKNALTWQIKSKQWKEGYVPNPTTYLNQSRWEDEPSKEVEGKFDPMEYIMNKNKENDNAIERDITNDIRLL